MINHAKDASGSTLSRRGVLACLCSALFLWFPVTLRGQSAWQVTPYRVAVRIAVDPACGISPQGRSQLGNHVAARLRSAVPSYWQTDVKTGIAKLSPAIAEPEFHTASVDKVFEVRVAPTNTPTNTGENSSSNTGSSSWGLSAVVHELDTRTRTMSRQWVRQEIVPAQLAAIIARGVLQTFRPLARITKVEGTMLQLEEQAAALRSRHLPTRSMEVGRVLVGAVRTTDSLGRPRPGGTRSIPYTCIEIVSADGLHLQGRIHSALRTPLSARTSLRTEQIGILTEPPRGPVAVQLRDKESGQPLWGYEILASNESGFEPVGTTDPHGTLDVAPCPARAITTLLIRHGHQAVARMPLIPEATGVLQVDLPSDESRLRAEAFASGMERRLIDIAAQRRILQMQIDRRLEAGEGEQAKARLEQLRLLPERTQLLAEIERERTQLAVDDPAMQQKIDQVLGELGELVRQTLSASVVSEMTTKVNAGG